MSPGSRRRDVAARAAALRADPERHVLLFFRAPETDRLLPYDRYLKRLVRPVYNRVSTSQKVSGFELWFLLLTEALERAGLVVHTNDRPLAQANPDHPVGLVGYPVVLDRWDLPNPAVLGPSLFDHPQQRPELMTDPRYRAYLVTCDWMARLFGPAYGQAVHRWQAGIDTGLWHRTPEADKTVDVLVYDKVRWNRDALEPSLIDPVLDHLRQSGRTVQVLRYGQYDHDGYRRSLARCRTMVFLCEHETQGMAYQEAMASGVPICAWDAGVWRDPEWAHRTHPPVTATSVPYFDERCGVRFGSGAEFGTVFDPFWEQRERFDPRDFVETELTFDRSAAMYRQVYFDLLA